MPEKLLFHLEEKAETFWDHSFPLYLNIAKHFILSLRQGEKLPLYFLLLIIYNPVSFFRIGTFPNFIGTFPNAKEIVKPLTKCKKNQKVIFPNIRQA